MSKNLYGYKYVVKSYPVFLNCSASFPIEDSSTEAALWVNLVLVLVIVVTDRGNTESSDIDIRSLSWNRHGWQPVL